MHSLRRDGDGFEVSRTGVIPDEETEILLPHTRSHRHAKVDYRAWKRFLEKKGRVESDMDRTLKESWQRCLDLQVDPAPRRCWDIMPMDQLTPFTSTLDRICSEVESRVFESIKGKGLLFTITNAQGRVARTCGDAWVLSHAEKMNFGPGANWEEGSVGTNAIGTALATGCPIQVFDTEHFCESHHGWNCTAAPIFDPRGNVWGSFDISGLADADHSNVMQLVLQASRALEQNLSRLYCSELEGQMASIFSSMFNSVITGLLFLDKNGRVTSANNVAEILLKQANIPLRGCRADAFFDLGPFLAAPKQASMCEPVTIPCLTNPSLFVQAMPTFSPGGSWLDTIVTVSETQLSRHLAVTGRSTKKKNRHSTKPPEGFEHVLHGSMSMRQAVRQAANAARTPSTVLLTGESGTGKELFAKGIHQAGPRADHPFVAVNCGAFSEELVQSELFGYREGAFTGAVKRGRVGKFEKADKGVLFLDEISEMPLSQQVNLLRALEERAVVPVGGTTPHPVDVKIIAATNKDLQELVRQGRFREDLYYRLNVVGVAIPPLRERGNDIELLAEHHLQRLCSEFGLDCPVIAPEAMAMLLAHHWPGNVRELVNCLEFAINNLSGDELQAGDLPPYLGTRVEEGACNGKKRQCREFELKKREESAIREALDHYAGNISKTASALGIGRNTLYSKMQRYGIQG